MGVGRDVEVVADGHDLHGEQRRPVGEIDAGGVALGAAIAVAVLYAAMVVVRLVVHGRRRLQLMAAAMIVMAVVALVAVWVVADVTRGVAEERFERARVAGIDQHGGRAGVSRPDDCAGAS